MQVLEAESNARQMPEGSDQRAEMLLGSLKKGWNLVDYFGELLFGAQGWSRVVKLSRVFLNQAFLGLDQIRSCKSFFCSDTHRKTNIFSENQWLEHVFPIERRSLFKGTNLSVFGGVFVLIRDSPRKDAAFRRQCFTEWNS